MLGTHDEWVKRSSDVYPTLMLGMHTLKFNDRDLAENVRSGGLEVGLEMADFIDIQAKAYKALGEMLGAANLRLLAVMQRVVLEQEAVEAPA